MSAITRPLNIVSYTKTVKICICWLKIMFKKQNSLYLLLLYVHYFLCIWMLEMSLEMS